MFDLKAVIVGVVLGLVLIGCTSDAGSVDPGESIEIGAYPTPSDYYSTIRALPKNADNITYLGRGWYTFSIRDNCFLLSETGRSSVMSRSTLCITSSQ